MKQLYVGNMFWPSLYTAGKSFASLQHNDAADAVIIGGGMSGMICAALLAQSGVSAIVLEQDEIASGSSSANTGLLQYCNDIMLTELSHNIGKDNAELFYRACRQAIDDIGQIAEKLYKQAGFQRRSSLYIASTEQDVPKLKQECSALQAAGLQAKLWTADQISEQYPFRRPAAIVTEGDAEIDPYLFVTSLSEYAADKGVKIYEHTEMTGYEKLSDGSLRINTSSGWHIDAKHLIYAVGYEPEQLRSKLIKANLNRTFVIVTDVQSNLEQWHERQLIWETARPYFYMRTTEQGHIIAGGLDEAAGRTLDNKQSRLKKNSQLLQKIQSFFPEFDAPVKYEWNAIFGESRDGLPFIGSDPLQPNIFYSLGYGGNGTVYSMLAAGLIRDLIQGKANPLAQIVALHR
ncbi:MULTISPECIES: NAD(P)/FAD-dependent oxidoreductase [unclassified Paenibacillus]|uniref:NAD(P)/FAD-dependent oxidoreductase n=1 Tax=unclassified Paenibacillus TaxID=185978 RepID=UPI002F41CFDE